jgi:hypothetical protein
MGNSDLVTILNLKDEKEIIPYEKILFRSFPLSKSENEDPCFIYDYKNKQLRTVINYEKQKVYTIKPNGRIICGLSVNIDMKDKLQLELDGFEVDRSEKKICEVLLIFNIGDVNYLKKLTSFVLEDLKNMGYLKIYSTCYDKFLKPYIDLGFEVHKSTFNKNLLSWNIK